MENWETLITFTHPHEAYLVKGLLESGGIETIVRDELTAQVYSLYSNAIGGVKLDVQQNDFNNANALLIEKGYITVTNEDYKQGIETVILNETTDTSLCPFCQSDNVSRKKEASIFVVVLYFLLGAIFPIFKRHFICYDCHKEWKYSKK